MRTKKFNSKKSAYDFAERVQGSVKISERYGYMVIAGGKTIPKGKWSVVYKCLPGTATPVYDSKRDPNGNYPSAERWVSRVTDLSY